MGERIIHILPEQVASRIAAGEVVERPASALKELIENSIDAGARRIDIALEGGGAGLIAVGDDGCGMGREDAIVALRRHATSKIRDASDLAAIRTLGFRGEALASIASVARLRMRTRRAADPAGIEIFAPGGEVETARECAIAPGTRIEVRDLFFNTPARLKFLKRPAAEQAAAVEAATRLALANFRIAFTLSVDGRTIHDLPRAATLAERIRQLFGARLAERMLAFDWREAGMRAWGLAATSQESFATPRMALAYVNGRAVRDRLIARAIAQSYQTLLPRGRFPALALFVELRPEEVDVNVHPMKTEVRFRNGGAVFELIYHALRARLADQTESDAAEARPQTSGRAPAEADEKPRPLRLVVDQAAARPATQAPLGLGYGGARGGAAALPAPALAGPTERSLVNESADAPGEKLAPDARSSAQGHTIPRYSELRVLGQIFTGYIALEDEEGLLLVDQHAAHERVTFERLRAELRAGGVRVQALLAPATLDLERGRAALAMANLGELRAAGFDLEPFGPATLMLKGAPAVFGPAGGVKLLADMIETMGEGGARTRGEGAFEEVLKRLACHGSIRVGRTLRADEIAALLADLDATEFKTNCPHGRPVHVRFARGQIERMFRR
jgi:DNA mismatch repair protein MutL